MRKGFIAAAAIAAGFTASAALAQGSAVVPAKYHGRWAPTVAGCAVSGFDSLVLTVDAKSWRGYEDGAWVTARLSAKAGYDMFRESIYAGAEEVKGTLGLKLVGGKLLMRHTNAGQTTEERLVRCR